MSVSAKCDLCGKEATGSDLIFCEACIDQKNERIDELQSQIDELENELEKLKEEIRELEERGGD